jgi:hypothetical protein
LIWIRKRFRRGSVAQSVEQRPFKALVPGSSPGRPRLSKVAFTYENRRFIDGATRRTKTHENTIYLASIRQQASP